MHNPDVPRQPGSDFHKPGISDNMPRMYMVIGDARKLNTSQGNIQYSLFDPQRFCSCPAGLTVPPPIQIPIISTLYDHFEDN